MHCLFRVLGPVLWLDRVAFFDADLTRPALEIEADVPVQCLVASADQLLTRYRAVLGSEFGVDGRELERRVARSHVCVLGTVDGAVIAMAWLAFNGQRVSEIGRTMVLCPGEVLSYDEFTVPAWRGHGISPCLNRFSDDYARSRNAARKISWRRLGNRPAMRVAGKLGHRLICVVTVVRWMGRATEPVFGLAQSDLPELSRTVAAQSLLDVAGAAHRIDERQA